jgi:hypothetical protein
VRAGDARYWRHVSWSTSPALRLLRAERPATVYRTRPGRDREQGFTVTVRPGQTAMARGDWYPDRNEVQCENLMQVG